MGRGLDGFSQSALREWRRRRGLTQAQLAELADLRPSNICALERGQQRPSVQSAHRLAAALVVDVESLLTEPPANPLVRLRLRAGLTQRQAADLVGLPVSTYAELEQLGVAVPKSVTALTDALTRTHSTGRSTANAVSVDSSSRVQIPEPPY